MTDWPLDKWKDNIKALERVYRGHVARNGTNKGLGFQVQGQLLTAAELGRSCQRLSDMPQEGQINIILPPPDNHNLNVLDLWDSNLIIARFIPLSPSLQRVCLDSNDTCGFLSILSPNYSLSPDTADWCDCPCWIRRKGIAQSTSFQYSSSCSIYSDIANKATEGSGKFWQLPMPTIKVCKLYIFFVCPQISWAYS